MSFEGIKMPQNNNFEQQQQKKHMAKHSSGISGYWFPNWIRVSLWQNSNKVKGQAMIHNWPHLSQWPWVMLIHSANTD